MFDLFGKERKRLKETINSLKYDIEIKNTVINNIKLEVEQLLIDSDVYFNFNDIKVISISRVANCDTNYKVCTVILYMMSNGENSYAKDILVLTCSQKQHEELVRQFNASKVLIKNKVLATTLNETGVAAGTYTQVILNDRWDVSTDANPIPIARNGDVAGDDIGRVNKIVVANRKELLEFINTSPVNANLNYLDVSNVTDMSNLFFDNQFNGVISDWNVSSVTDMSFMFYNSQFTGDIFWWDTSKVLDMSHMFHDSKFNGDISQWDVSNVTNMTDMFLASEFNGDISKWKKQPI